MAYEFPSNPTVGDTYDNFTWNGSAWTRTSTPTGPTDPVAAEFTFQSTTYGAVYRYRDTSAPGSGVFSIQPEQTDGHFLVFNAETANGTDLTNAWLASGLRGSEIYVQDKDDASNYAVYVVDANTYVASGYVEAPVSEVVKYGTFGNNQECIVMSRGPSLRSAVLRGDDVRELTAPTGADGEPSDYNIVVIDKADGSIKTIPAIDVIEVE